MPKVRFDKFYRYDELTKILRAWAKEKPGLFKLSSIGKSYEGRDIWLASITNNKTGPDKEKPAFWLEANIHAGEVTTCTAALHLIDKLLTQYSKDEKVTRVLDTRAFYVVPRLNPDGAEWALSNPPKLIRSSTRPYPSEEEADGLHREDVDKDGRILTMRMQDANGPWKVYPKDKRLMIRREPDDGPNDGPYYRLLPEGGIRNYDGVTIKIAKPLQGLDINRNFPADWAPEGEQSGAGPYPTSEPEIRAEVQAITDRPNVTGFMSYHTHSGVHLRPYSGYDDKKFPVSDLRAFKWLGEKATEITGYPTVSVFHEFRYHPKQEIKGVSADWIYDHLGVFAWVTEFWAPLRQAGITDYKFIDWYLDHPLEDELKVLEWNDKKLKGKGFVRWYKFDHPQLGKVELGGWDMMNMWANPPLQFLEKEIAPHADFLITHLLGSPKLEIHSLDVEAVGTRNFLVRLVLINTGWLPTNLTQKALDRKIVRQIQVELTLPKGARLVSGEEKVEAGQLTGRFDKRTSMGWGSPDATTDRVKIEWVIEAPKGGTLKIEAHHQRAGVVRAKTVLK